jgi:lipopolysaccharide/colanic/teichoic acid biosynthesis glycosyltransferase
MTDHVPQTASRRTAASVLVGRCSVFLVLLLAAPLMLLIALAIVLESGFPVFFSQERLGLNGRRFVMLKFRKFHRQIGRDTVPLTMANDARCTRVGRFLAKSKLDELPQLWNVARGDMALVGPRPEVPEFESCFAGSFRGVLDYRPGIFGPSQVAFRSEGAMFPQGRDPQDFYREVLFPAKAALDLAYYPSRSIMSDLKWVLRSVLAVFGSEHAMPGEVIQAARPPGLAGPAGDGDLVAGGRAGLECEYGATANDI